MPVDEKFIENSNRKWLQMIEEGLQDEEKVSNTDGVDNAQCNCYWCRSKRISIGDA